LNNKNAQLTKELENKIEQTNSLNEKLDEIKKE